MWRYIFLVFCSVITFFICGYFINLIQLILYFTVKQISRDLYYKINYYLCYSYNSILCFYGEWYTGCELYVYMDRNDFKNHFGKEHMFVISNHTGEVDWMFLALLCEKSGLLGNGICYAKQAVKYIPGYGLNYLISDFIRLHRNYSKDKENIQEKMKILMNYPDNIFLVLAPEGTRFSREKHELSVKFAKEKGLPILKHLLTPRTKAFTTSLPLMQDKIKAVYDITIAFSPNETAPKLINLLLGKKIKSYVYIKRILIKDVPKDEAGASKFIHNLFLEKDKLIDSFYKTGDFVTEYEGSQVEKMKMKKSYLSLIIGIVWYIFSMGIVFFVLIRLLQNGQKSAILIIAVVYIFFLIITYKVGSLAVLKTAPVHKDS